MGGLTVDINSIKAAAKEKFKGACRLCPVCNGRICAGEVPGMGGLGTGAAFKHNVTALAECRLNLRTVHSVKNPELSCKILGMELALPIIAAAIGGIGMNMMLDKEPVNYIEAAGLYGMIAQGRFNAAMLQVLYNHAQDPDLKSLIKEAIDAHNKMTIVESEELLADSEGHAPKIRFNQRNLHKTPLDIPTDAHLTDQEIAIAVGTMAKASQVALLTALHQSYQLEVALMFRKALDDGLDFDYRLLQLMLNRGWLPHLAKITH